MSETDFDLVRKLAAAQRERTLSLEELAAVLEMSPSLLQRRLKALVSEGWVERRQTTTPRGRIVHYRPLARVSVQWVSSENDIAFSWTSNGEPMWDFPLVSQVPDRLARASIRRFLWMLSDAGLARDERYVEEGVNIPVDVRGVAVIVYGSTARGQARADSDVDVLVIVPDATKVDEISDIAAAASVDEHAPRPLQAKVVGLRESKKTGNHDLPKLPPQISSEIRESGLIVYDSLHRRDLWDLVYGGRSR